MDVAGRSSWWEVAACRGQDASSFFAPAYFEKRAEKLAREAVAKSFCRRCEVREECLSYALEHRDPHGVWGGLNEMERRAVLRQRASERQAS
ncbi:MAG TPA: WhiB family transcriptional regulator [Actinomycetota bacterium]|nr:WhiB family transcriptional regulator [Actinomycetota bacterium]